MANRRWKDTAWNVADENGKLHDGMKDAVTVAVLMDIRDELKALNRILGCHNFLRVPSVLDEIKSNTRKRTYNKKSTLDLLPSAPATDRDWRMK